MAAQYRDWPKVWLPWPSPVIAANASALQCIGRCVCSGSPANFRLKAPQRISAAKDCIASPESRSNEANACNARSLFLEGVSALVNQPCGCNATSRLSEWNLFTVVSAWVAKLRITRSLRRNQPPSVRRHKLTTAASMSRINLMDTSGLPNRSDMRRRQAGIQRGESDLVDSGNLRPGLTTGLRICRRLTLILVQEILPSQWKWESPRRRGELDHGHRGASCAKRQFFSPPDTPLCACSLEPGKRI